MVYITTADCTVVCQAVIEKIFKKSLPKTLFSILWYMQAVESLVQGKS